MSHELANQHWVQGKGDGGEVACWYPRERLKFGPGSSAANVLRASARVRCLLMMGVTAVQPSSPSVRPAMGPNTACRRVNTSRIRRSPFELVSSGLFGTACNRSVPKDGHDNVQLSGSGMPRAPHCYQR